MDRFFEMAKSALTKRDKNMELSCRTCSGISPGRRTLQATSPQDLNKLRPWRKRYSDIHLEFLNEPERAAFEAMLQKNYLACGCTAARVTFFIGLAVLTLAGFALNGIFLLYPSKFCIIAFLSLGLATSLAMLVSVVRAHRNVGYLVDMLIRTRT